MPAAIAHGTLSPPSAPAGSTQIFELTVPADRQDADIIGVALRVTAGVAVQSAEARQPLWAVSWDDEGVSWQGGPIERGSAETFRFTARMPAEAGVAELALVETYDDGEATPFPISVTVAEAGGTGGSDDTLAVAALVVALCALAASTAALALVLRGRHSPSSGT